MTLDEPRQDSSSVYLIIQVNINSVKFCLPLLVYPYCRCHSYTFQSDIFHTKSLVLSTSYPLYSDFFLYRKTFITDTCIPSEEKIMTLLSRSWSHVPVLKLSQILYQKILDPEGLLHYISSLQLYFVFSSLNTPYGSFYGPVPVTSFVIMIFYYGVS